MLPLQLDSTVSKSLANADKIGRLVVFLSFPKKGIQRIPKSPE